MALSYPLSLPAGIRTARKIRFRQRSTVGVSASPFTQEQQTYVHAGEWWEAEVELPPMGRADAEAWNGFLLALNGREGSFLMGDPVGAIARGSWSGGSPVLQGAHASGIKTLQVRGVDGLNWKAGDWIQIGTGSSTRLHKVTQDGSQSGSPSVGTVEIWPRLRTSYSDGQALTLASAKGQWRRADNAQEWDVDVAAVFGLSFSLVENLS